MKKILYKRMKVLPMNSSNVPQSKVSRVLNKNVVFTQRFKSFAQILNHFKSVDFLLVLL